MSSLFLHKTLIFNVLNTLIPIELMLIKKLNNQNMRSGEVRNAKWESLKTLLPSQIGSCGGDPASVSEPTF